MLNLLVGESQSFLAELYHEKLTNLGHRVTICKYRKECITKYQKLVRENISGCTQNILDVVIVDEGLLDDGLKTIDEILSIAPRQKVLFITSHKKSMFPPKDSTISIIEKPFPIYGMIQKLEELESGSEAQFLV